jgi:polyhydroxyalkanoate synthase subunit PhaC
MEDIQKGRITRVDESAFEVGRNLAVTPGSVVFENELIQLIQYTPQTREVEKTPLLVGPPCINKYYLLDLGPGNSFVEYAVRQGHQVFLISWRSAVPEIEHLTWDDYLTKGPLKAIDAVCHIANVKRLHALGFCVGGTILSCAAGVLAARGEDRLVTLTLLTTMLDFYGHRRYRTIDRRGLGRLARGDDRKRRYPPGQGTSLYIRNAARQRSDLALCCR